MEGDWLKHVVNDSISLTYQVQLFVSPLQAFFRSYWYCLTIVFFSCFFLFEACTATVTFASFGVSSHENYRFTVMLDSTNLTTSPTHLNLSGELHLLRRGCTVHTKQFAALPKVDAFQLVSVDLPKPLEVDGFAVNVSALNTGVGPLLLVLEGTDSTHGDWSFVGQTSAFRKVSDGIRYFSKKDNLPPNGNMYTYDLRAPWPLFVESVMTKFLLAATLIVPTVLSWMNKLDTVVNVLIFFSAAFSINQIICIVGYIVLDLPIEACGALPYLLVYALLGSSLWFTTSYLASMCVSLGVLGWIARFVEDCMLVDDCAYLFSSPPTPSYLFILVGIVLWLHRAFVLSQSMRAIRGDQAELDALWRVVITSPAEREAVERLGEISGRADASRPVRHCIVMRKAATHELAMVDPAGCEARSGARIPPMFASTAGRNAGSIPGSGDPVTSLAQLYTQAVVTSVVLEAYSAEWAAASGGVLSSCLAEAGPKVRGPAETHGDAATLVHMPESLEERVHRRTVKCPRRAIEKAAACYGGDVSRVVDICRARIVFDDVQGILGCLQRVLTRDGGAVRTVRVKSSMDLGHSSLQTAGFRGVVVNLRFDCEATKALGVDNHVCELQLVLSSLLHQDNLERHRRFLNFRSLRAHLWKMPQCKWAMYCAKTTPQPEIDVVVVNNIVPPSSGHISSLKYMTEGLTSVHGDHRAIGPAAVSVEVADQLAIRMYAEAALNPGGALDKQAALGDKGLAMADVGSILFTRFPIAAAFSRTSIQILFMLIGIRFLLDFLSQYDVSSPSFPAAALRLRALWLRDGAPGTDGGRLADFGFMLNGCPVPAPHGATMVNNSAVALYDLGTRANGYYFVTSDGPDAADPVRWVVEASADNATSSAAGTWSTVGASAWTAAKSQLYPGIAYPTPTGGLQRVAVDMRWSWADAVVAGQGNLEWFLALTYGVVRARLGDHGGGRAAVTAACAVNAALNLLSIAGYAALGNAPAAINVCLDAPANLYRLYIVAFHERLFVNHWLGGSSLLSYGCILAGMAYFAQPSALMNHLSNPNTVCLGLWIFFHLLRWRALFLARRLVLADSARYDAAWDQVVRDDRPGLVRLSAAAAQLAARCQPGPPKHLCHRRATCEAEGMWGIFSRVASDNFSIGRVESAARSEAGVGNSHHERTVLGSVSEVQNERMGRRQEQEGAFDDVLELNRLGGYLGGSMIGSKCVADPGIDGNGNRAMRTPSTGGSSGGGLEGTDCRDVMGVRFEEEGGGVDGGVFGCGGEGLAQRADLVGSDTLAEGGRTSTLPRDSEGSADGVRGTRAPGWGRVVELEYPGGGRDTAVDGSVSSVSDAWLDMSRHSMRGGLSRAGSAGSRGGLLPVERTGSLGAQISKRLSAAASASMRSLLGSMSVENGMRPVTSLDQVFAQAHLVHPLLLLKVRTWAAATRGMFRVARCDRGGSRSEERAMEAATGDFVTEAQAGVGGVQFAKVKTVVRAIEKLVRSYGKDPSLLVDVCRQSIVFTTASDLASALEAVGRDPDVDVMRVKNRLEPAEGGTTGASASSGGYRNVCVNLRLRCEEAQRVGADGHVCEVQLLLLPFARIKSDEGHRRYIFFRNLRGE